MKLFRISSDDDSFQSIPNELQQTSCLSYMILVHLPHVQTRSFTIQTEPVSLRWTKPSWIWSRVTLNQSNMSWHGHCSHEAPDGDRKQPEEKSLCSVWGTGLTFQTKTSREQQYDPLHEDQQRTAVWSISCSERPQTKAQLSSANVGHRGLIRTELGPAGGL